MLYSKETIMNKVIWVREETVMKIIYKESCNEKRGGV